MWSIKWPNNEFSRVSHTNCTKNPHFQILGSAPDSVIIVLQLVCVCRHFGTFWCVLIWQIRLQSFSAPNFLVMVLFTGTSKYRTIIGISNFGICREVVLFHSFGGVVWHFLERGCFLFEVSFIGGFTVVSCTIHAYLTLAVGSCSASFIALASSRVWGIAVPMIRITTSINTTTPMITSNTQSWIV